MENIFTKLNNIEKWFEKNNHHSVVALSGGVDSCLVVFLAKKCLGKNKVLAVISASPSLKQKDLNIAKEFCNKFEINFEIIETNEIHDPQYTANPQNRCYFCKISLYNELNSIAKRFPESIVLNGLNYDDYHDYRPGIKAAEEFNVYHPLADCKITKIEIREIAKYFDLPVWDKPASPCLSSRIPYGNEVNIEKLKQIEDAENILNSFGFNDVRVRHFNNLAVIEVPLNQLAELKNKSRNISSKILQVGFEEVKIDEEGLISGKLNRKIYEQKS